MYEHNADVNVEKTMLFGVGWKSSAQIIIMGSFFVVMTVLALLLEPADIGIFGMAEGIVQFLIILMASGVDFAIIQQRNITDTILSTVFWLGLGIGVLLSLISIAIAPLFSSYFQEPQVTVILSTLSLTFVLRGLSVVHRGISERQMAFRKVALIDIWANVLASVAAIVVAYVRRDYWALVTLSLARNALISLGFLVFSKWQPRLVFDIQESKNCVHFSANMMVYNSLYFFTRRSDVFLIGRLLSSDQLGYYLMAYQLVFRPAERLITAVSSTLYPVLATLQNDLARLRETFTSMIYAVFLLMAPLLATVAVVSPQIFDILGEKWQASVPIFMVWCYGAIHALLVSQTGLLFLSTGRPDLHWKYQAVATVAVIVSLLAGIGLYGELGAALAINAAQTLLSILLIRMGFSQVNMKASSFFSHFKVLFLAILTQTALGTLITWQIGLLDINPYLHILVVGAAMVLAYSGIVFGFDSNARKYLHSAQRQLAPR